MTRRRRTQIIRAHEVELASQTVVVAEVPQNSPEVTIHRSADRIECIEIRCRCGEKLTLDCESPNVSQQD